jgi:hypothetical protein
MAQQDYRSWLLGLFKASPYDRLPTGNEEAQTAQVKPNIGQILRSKRFRIVGPIVFAMLLLAAGYYHKGQDLSLHYFRNTVPSMILKTPQTPKASYTPSGVDWSRYAYVQYVTNPEYLCNSVMLFEILHRLGSKPDRLMMYPDTMSLDVASSNSVSMLLLKARDEYQVKLMPVTVQHRSGGDGWFSSPPSVRTVLSN